MNLRPCCGQCSVQRVVPMCLAVLILVLGGCADRSVTALDESGAGSVGTEGQAVDGIQLATVENADALPEAVEDRVAALIADLDALLAEFDDQTAPFDDDRLNRALRKARTLIVQARAAAFEGDLNGTFRAWKGAMRELEKGASVPVSGSGFADDLASLGSFLAEVFTGDLIDLAAQQQMVSPGQIEDAMLAFEEGVAERDVQEWERSLRHFGRAIRILSAGW